MEASDADLYLAASSLASSSSKPAESCVLLRITFEQACLNNGIQ
jgi:hypothetical protein